MLWPSRIFEDESEKYMSNKEKKHRRREDGSSEKKKGKKQRGHHHHSSSSNGSDEEDKFDKRLKLLREKKKAKKKSEKAKIKETETLEEKKARRVAKKLKKVERNSTNVVVDEVKYTDTNNPFNDPNLTTTFIWTRKLAAEGKSGLSLKRIQKMNRDRALKNLAEMEELKRNRKARDAAREDLEMIRRDEERRHNSDWHATEEEFLLSQAKLRTHIRLKEGRAKPIDLLARYISYDNKVVENQTDDEFEFVDPLSYLKGFKTRDLEDLLEDIKIYRKIDSAKNAMWWADFCTVVNHEIRKLSNDISSADVRESVHNSVQKDINQLFKNKTHQELDALDSQIKKKIRSGEPGTDVEFLEFTLQHLHVHMAKARITERHQEILQHKLKMIKQEQKVETHKREVEQEQYYKDVTGKHLDDSAQSVKLKILPVQLDDLDYADDELKEQKWRLLNEEEMEILTLEMYKRGSYSPSYGDEKDAMPGIEILDEAEDAFKLKHMMDEA
ncbi:unnamed protein product, partial [Thelazia callipaeda]|uniref:Cactin_mid domain-containing protein n=1 Tax=Thelazia callipaeda TaxID=103827 RepID=A0A0N5CM76_THECL